MRMFLKVKIQKWITRQLQMLKHVIQSNKAYKVRIENLV